METNTALPDGMALPAATLPVAALTGMAGMLPPLPSDPAELAAASELMHSLALFSMADLSSSAAGRELLVRAGFDSATEAQLTAGREAQYELARLQALTSRIVDEERLARYARVQLASMVGAARTAADAAGIALALRRFPAWALESEEQRESRHAAEAAQRSARSTPRQSSQPGSLTRERARQAHAEDELFTQSPRRSAGRSTAAAGHGEAQASPALAAGRPESQAGYAAAPHSLDIDLLEREQAQRSALGGDDQECALPTDAAEEDQELAALWHGHAPHYAATINARRDGVRHYLELCRGLEPLDMAVLDSVVLPPDRDLEQETGPSLEYRLIAGLEAIAHGIWPPGGGHVVDQATGLTITPAQAGIRLQELQGT
jgi:hypothetical protein